MFEVKSIQADNGDSLLVSYGAADKPYHLLIDGGTADTKDTLLRVLSMHRVQGRLRLEALVVTHYDLDHIGGILELLRDPPEWLDIRDIWFNGRHHLLEADILGHEEGTELSRLIAAKYPWNAAFGGNAVQMKAGKVTVEGGLEVTVLSPDEERLMALAAEWPANSEPLPDLSDVDIEPDILGKHDTWPPGSFRDLTKEKSSKDTSAANGSSIALMLEYAAKRVLLTGDAFSSVVSAAIKSTWTAQRPAVDLFKLSHHGSKRNTDAGLLGAVDCQRFLFSSNGRTHKHPDAALIARVLDHSSEPELVFNYEQERTSGWRTVPDGWPPYTTKFPEPGTDFVKIVL